MANSYISAIPSGQSAALNAATWAAAFRPGGAGEWNKRMRPFLPGQLDFARSFSPGAAIITPGSERLWGSFRRRELYLCLLQPRILNFKLRFRCAHGGSGKDDARSCRVTFLTVLLDEPLFDCLQLE
jgi:hypothetical protein